MSDYARAHTSTRYRTMRDKAERLTRGDPHEKVDGSSWTEAEPLNANVQTGERPVSKRQYKRGGKVQGEHAAVRADRKPRKSGGRLANALINRNVKDANEEREGPHHVGGMKRGGKAHKDAGGPLSGAISQGIGGQGRMSFSYPQAQSLMQRAGGLKRGGKAGHSDEKEDRALVRRMVKKPALTGKKAGGEADHWIAGATKNKGALHRELHVPQGEKIPAKKLKKAEHSKNPAERKRADLAETLKHMHKDREHRARGGKAGKMNVNVIIAQPGADAQGAPQGMAAMPMPPQGGPGPLPAAQKPPQVMPVPVPIGGGAPMGMAPPQQPMPPPMGRKRGGRASYPDMEYGAGGGEGRLEKAKAYGKRSHEVEAR